MAVSALTNVTSLATQRAIGKTHERLSSNISKLSSGQRVSVASEDASGLGISEKLRIEARSHSQAIRNASDGISLSQVAEGALGEIGGILTRMKELAMQASNGVLGATERGFLDNEFQHLKSEIDRISTTTEFDTRNLLSGSSGATKHISLQVGIRDSANDRVTITIDVANVSAFGISGTTLSTQSNAQQTIDTLDTAIGRVSKQRSNLGALQNHLKASISNLSIMKESLESSDSRIRDVDFAEELATLTKNQILSQSGAAMLSQANQITQVAVPLLSR